ncbi:hypothetical protein B0H34DRAFT_803172 [Crassisporium funariophilum]|nr:hypothetical protein B0H34DRAFT_803172 [Crassisporium funariophilum]
MLSNSSMKFLASILLSLAVAPALAQINQDSCFAAGTTGSCAEFISTFCADVHAATFRPSDSGGRCFNKNGFRCDLMNFNSATSSGPPDLATCNTVLNAITQTCPMGGVARLDSQHPDYFSIDPNAGSCSNELQYGS